MIWSSHDITGLPHLWGLALILLLDWSIGDPQKIYRHIPHPVVWMGSFLNLLEQTFHGQTASNRCRKGAGILTLVLYLGTTLTLAYGIQHLFDHAASSPVTIFLYLLLASIFLSYRSLIDHVRAVATPLRHKDIPHARHQVSMIVGRKTDQMDGPAISRAAIESLAENFSDGVIAPAFWFAVAGLPGLIIYKAINTADSMIGHKNDRYLHFGWAAARLDDVANYIPARLTALLIILSASVRKSASPQRACETALRDAPRHLSPNAGWPEAALAGALDLRLGGPRSYNGETTQGAWMGTGRENLCGFDIDQSLTLMFYSMCNFFFILLIWGIMIQ